MKKYVKEMNEIREQFLKDEISMEEFKQRQQSINKKYDIFIQEKIIKSNIFSISFSIFAVVICSFISIFSVIDGKIFPFITNGLLAIFNSINLYINIKKLNKLKIKLIKDCLT